MVKRSVIVVAGGAGNRMDSAVPKQFLLLSGRPMLMHSMVSFDHAFPGIPIVVALPFSHFDMWHSLCEEHAFELPHQLVAGGETRFQSVKNALSCIGSEGLVAIHDGARPLVSETLIRTLFLAASLSGNSIPAIPLNESLRVTEGDASRAVNRSLHRVVQTPQVFHAAVIKKAYEQVYRESFTDDATVAESIGETIHLTDGDPVNMKVTHRYDLAAAEALLAARGSS